MIRRLLRHLAWEGPRHDGRYGFAGRRSRLIGGGS